MLLRASAGELRCAITCREKTILRSASENSPSSCCRRVASNNGGQSRPRRLRLARGKRVRLHVALVPGDDIAPRGALHVLQFRQKAVGLREDAVRLVDPGARGDQPLRREERQNADEDDDQECEAKREFLPVQRQRTD